MKRLTKIASLIQGTQLTVADVGADHGYLGEILLAKNQLKLLICTDNKQGPLNACRKTLAKYNKGNISFMLTSGLQGVSFDFDYVVVAGMGYDLISQIVSEFPKIPKHLIVQSNTRNDLLRKNLAELGWYLEIHTVVKEGKYFYEIMVYKHQGQKILLSPSEIIVGKLDLNDLETNEYLTKKISNAHYIAKRGEEINIIKEYIESYEINTK